jgi:uncharacterized protein (DUF433 family)
MLGKPVIRGTRITVELILEKLAAYISIEEILADYPRMTRSDVLEVQNTCRRCGWMHEASAAARDPEPC